ncbi:hypothetical protein FQZ97_997770 [compost metagenome]
MPGQQHLAGAGLVEAGDHPQRGGLATAGTAEEGVEGAAPHLEVQAVDRRHRAIALDHIAELDIDELACVAHGRPLVPGVPGMWPQASYGGFRLYISLGG